MKIGKFIRDLQKKNIFTLTAAVTFFSFLSVFPFLLLILSLAGMVVNKSTVLIHLQKILEPFPPSVAETLIQIMTGMMENSGVLSIISFLFLVWAALQMFLQMQNALHRIMGTPRQKKLTSSRQLWKFLKAIVFFVLFSLFLLTMLVMGSTLLKLLAKMNLIPVLRSYIMIEIVYVGMEILFFSFSYKWLAIHRLSWRSVFIAGTGVAVCWEILKHLFSWYISSMSIYSTLYGSIGSLFLFQLWLFFSILVYLVGAAACMALNKKQSV